LATPLGARHSLCRRNQVLIGDAARKGMRPLSKDLTKRGWTFVGPTTVYAFMQAMGLVNDHVKGCSVREPALGARAGLVLPRSLQTRVRHPQG
jgi:hypothetical protein